MSTLAVHATNPLAWDTAPLHAPAALVLATSTSTRWLSIVVSSQSRSSSGWTAPSSERSLKRSWVLLSGPRLLTRASISFLMLLWEEHTRMRSLVLRHRPRRLSVDSQCRLTMLPCGLPSHMWRARFGFAMIPYANLIDHVTFTEVSA